MRLFAALFVVACLSWPSAAGAQDGRFGVKGGLTFASLSFDTGADVPSSYRLGIAAGGFVFWPVGGRFALQPEVLFNRKGVNFDAEGLEAWTAIDYLEIPILARYAISSGARPFFVFGGPAIALKLRAESKATFGESTTETDVSEDIEDLDLGVAIGVGKEFSRFSVDGRYTHGFKSIDATGSDTKVRNRALTALVGVRF